MFFKPKVAKVAFNSEMLPKNRKEVFFDVVKLHFWQLLLCGLILFLFALPLHISAIVGDLYKSNLLSSITADTTLLQREEIALNLISFGNSCALIEIPLLMFFAVGLSGMMRVIRQYAWEENVFFRYDFAQGVKQNCGQTSLLAFIYGLIRFACIYVNNLSTLTKGEVYSYLGIAPSIILTLLFAPIVAYAFVTVSVYSNKLGDNIKLGFSLYYGNLFRTLLALLCCGALFIIQALPFFWCHIVGRLISTVALAFIMLGWWLFAYNRLDQKFNKLFHPELIGKGTFNQNNTEIHPETNSNL